MAYDIYPAVDENYRFPPEVQRGLFPNRGDVPNGTDMDTLRTPGFYGIGGSAHANTISNLPPGVSTSSVFVTDSGQSSNRMQSQIVFGNSRGGTWYRSAINTAGTWDVWTILGWDRSTLPGYSDFNELKAPGVYRIPKTSAHTHSNSPGFSEAANIMVLPTGDSDMVSQMAWETGASGSIHIRNSITPDTYTEWVDLGGGNDYWAQHSLRVSEFKRRRGGVLGTYGFGAVSFRLDHNWDDFIATNGIASLMEKHSIVGSMAVPAVEFDPDYSNQSTVGSFATMEKWALNHGLEIMSHSYTHKDAQSIPELDKEIRQSREYLQSQMPNIKIDVWAMPGVTPPAGKKAYMGVDTLARIEDIYGSHAGRMLIANYAVVGAHSDGYFRELTGDVDQGLIHYTIESETTATNVINIINQASRSGTGVVLMMHPNVIGNAGKMSLAVLEEIFVHVANLRDQGRIQNITVGGMALADSSSDRRRDLCFNGTFHDGLEGWTYSGSWTPIPGAAVAGGTAPLEQGDYWSRRAALAGSWHELVVSAWSSGTSVLELRVYDKQNPTVLDHSKRFTIGGTVKQCRLPFGIPFVGDATVPAIHPTWSIRRVSGNPLTVTNARVQAI